MNPARTRRAINLSWDAVERALMRDFGPELRGEDIRPLKKIAVGYWKSLSDGKEFHADSEEKMASEVKAFCEGLRIRLKEHQRPVVPTVLVTGFLLAGELIRRVVYC